VKHNISAFTKCANCGACYHTCPTDAITVAAGGMFYQPQVDEQRCVSCGKCVKVCPVNMPEKTKNLLSAYGGFHREEEVVAQSSSGGAFTAFAQQVLANGGVVFGAAYTEDFRRVEFANTDECDLERLCKSKYVESNVGDAFHKVKAALDSGREVLFCGAPCQVAGLKRWLGCEYEELYTCDFSCGGLPSHQIFADYLAGLEKKYKSPVVSVDFRPKTFGWKTHAIRVAFANGKQYSKVAVLDPYFRGFIFKRLTMRDNCYSCEFADNHASDVILADFWLHEKLSSLKDDDTGLSLMITNSPKGEKMIRAIAPWFHLQPLDLESASYNMKGSCESSEEFRDHQAFIANVEKEGFYAAARKYLQPDYGTVLKQWIKTILRAVGRT